MGVRSLVTRIAPLAALAAGGLYLYSRFASQRYETLEPEDAGAPGSFIDIDGRSIHYVESGTGEPIVLIHGLYGSTFSYRYTIPELAQRYRVVAIDLLGHGFSARPKDGDYSLSAQAALVERVMDRLGIKRAAIVGHSMGGNVAIRLATHAPQRVSRLVLVDCATDEDLRRGLRATRYLRPLAPIAARFAIQSERFQRRAVESVVHDPALVTPEVLEGVFRPWRVKGTLHAHTQLARHVVGDESLRPEAIAQPTLILWGEHDAVVPPERGDELAAAIPNARLVSIRSAGHLPLEEQPELCNQALLDFLTTAETDEAAVSVPSATTSG